MKNEFYTAKYFDVTEKEYENGDYLNGFCEIQREEMQKGFTVQEYYTDCAGVAIEEIDGDTFYYEQEFENMYGEAETARRYVIVIGYEEESEEE